VSQRLVSVAALALIARLISKDAYGVFRQLLSLHLICLVLLPLGFDQLFIREPEQRERLARMLQRAVAISALVIALVVWGFRPVLARWLDIESHAFLLWMFPVALGLQAAKIPLKTARTAMLYFRLVGVGEFVNTSVTMVGGALLLVWWRTPTALYLAYTVGEVLELLILLGRQHAIQGHTMAKHPGFVGANPAEWRFAALTTGDQLLNAIGTNAPILLLGAAVDHASAASFSMASSLVTMPLFLLVGTFSQVALPSLAGRSERDLQARTLEVLAASAGLIVPVLIGVAMFARPIVQIVLGPTWVAETVPLVAWLAFFCAAGGLFSPISTLDVIRDRMDLGFLWNVVNALLRVAALAWGYSHGLLVTVAAYAIVSAVMRIVQGFMLGWLLRAGMWRFQRTWLVFVPAWIGLVMLCYGMLLLPLTNPWLLLALSVIPAAGYLAILWVFYRSTADILLRLVKLRSGREGVVDLAQTGTTGLEQMLPADIPEQEMPTRSTKS
jgi:O-antigen/teichoic acid export membrane protein